MSLITFIQPLEDNASNVPTYPLREHSKSTFAELWSFLNPMFGFHMEKYILYGVFAFGQTFKVNVLFKYTQNPLEILSPKKDFVLEICLKVLMRNGQYSISVCKVLVY